MITVIKESNSLFKATNKKEYISRENVRHSRYVISVDVEEGLLLFNGLSFSMIFIEGKNNKDWLEKKFEEKDFEYLYENKFLVKESFEENKYFVQLRDLCEIFDNRERDKTKYVIYTTTACNARCEYCFEKGSKVMSMSEQTARDVAEYIIKDCKTKKIRLGWFGGEPLLNTKPIEIISEKLKKHNFEIESDMATNGYLLSEEKFDELIKEYNLKEIMIPIDGTEDQYNRIKNYTKTKGSPYKTVIENLKKIIRKNFGCIIKIRLNITRENFQNISDLVKEIIRWGIINENVKFSCTPTIQESSIEDEIEGKKILNAWAEVYKQIIEINKPQLQRKWFKKRCIAQDPLGISIYPNGDIGKCYSVLGKEPAGKINEGIKYPEKITKWLEEYKTEQCKTCELNPFCVRVKACIIDGECNQVRKGLLKTKIIETMKYQYECWKKELQAI